MSDKELIKHLKQIIEAQRQVIDAWELINTVQTQPNVTFTNLTPTNKE